MSTSACLDCHALFTGLICPSCGSKRVIHDEFFYAPEVRETLPLRDEAFKLIASAKADMSHARMTLDRLTDMISHLEGMI